MRKFWIPAILVLGMGLALMFVIGCDTGIDELIYGAVQDDESPAPGDEPDAVGKDEEDDEDEDEDEDENGDGEYDPDIDPDDFVAGIDNPYFPLTPGMTYIYEAETEDGVERIEVNVTDETRTVYGVECTVVRDRVWLDEDGDGIWADNEMIEDTFDWYAQDDDGNVWYFGEDTTEFEDGVAVNTEGSWESGIDGALPGVIMWAEDEMEIGVPYRQEYYEGEAEDMGEVLSLNEFVSVQYGDFDNCVKTKDWTPLEADVVAHKYHAPGVGTVLETEGEERVELVGIIEP